MRKASALLAFALSLSGGFAAADEKTTVEKIKFRDATAWRISDGVTEAVIVPAYGGRLMRYGKVGGANWLWTGQPEEVGEYMRWGGDKTFPGPHSMWHFTMPRAWPPPAPDTTEHAIEVKERSVVTTSPPWEAYGGARVVREYRFEKGELVISHRITPVPGSAVPVAAWVITQCEPAVAYVPLPRESPYKDAYVWLGGNRDAAQMRFASPTLLEITPKTGAVFKLGSHPERPALAAVRDGELFLQRAEVEARVRNPKPGEPATQWIPADPNSQYPEGTNGAGLSVEYYHHNLPPPRQYIELELLSPLRPAREGAALQTRWSLHTLHGDSPADAAAKILVDGK